MLIYCRSAGEKKKENCREQKVNGRKIQKTQTVRVTVEKLYFPTLFDDILL
jgi:hypothetical protein